MSLSAPSLSPSRPLGAEAPHGPDRATGAGDGPLGTDADAPARAARPAHAPTRRRAPGLRPSMLRMSLWARLAIALVMLLPLWAVVLLVVE